MKFYSKLAADLINNEAEWVLQLCFINKTLTKCDCSELQDATRLSP